MARFFWVLPLALSTVALSCAPAGRHGPSPYDGPHLARRSAAPNVTIDVENQHWLEVRVWVEWPGVHYLLGNVDPGTRNAFHVPGYLIDEMGSPRLYAEPMGSIDEVLTDPIELGHARRIEWKLKKVLENSRPRVM